MAVNGCTRRTERAIHPAMFSLVVDGGDPSEPREYSKNDSSRAFTLYIYIDLFSFCLETLIDKNVVSTLNVPVFLTGRYILVSDKRREQSRNEPCNPSVRVCYRYRQEGRLFLHTRGVVYLALVAVAGQCASSRKKSTYNTRGTAVREETKTNTTTKPDAAESPSRTDSSQQ